MPGNVKGPTQHRRRLKAQLDAIERQANVAYNLDHTKTRIKELDMDAVIAAIHANSTNMVAQLSALAAQLNKLRLCMNQQGLLSGKDGSRASTEGGEVIPAVDNGKDRNRVRVKTRFETEVETIVRRDSDDQLTEGPLPEFEAAIWAASG
ncbi:unnamed protein product [Prorocentrum cordatum]|uniref:Uncharacterized protein n=1 Tax=Prorocentrum cordatum TaxID=2364126 RepID=A0ABN9RM73_9DINO|nr:unnamed protein product [Polarella glacialis]